jgi:hypothetical protein
MSFAPKINILRLLDRFLWNFEVHQQNHDFGILHVFYHFLPKGQNHDFVDALQNSIKIDLKGVIY